MMRTKGGVRVRVGLELERVKGQNGGGSGNAGTFITWFVLNGSCVQIFCSVGEQLKDSDSVEYCHEWVCVPEEWPSAIH